MDILSFWDVLCNTFGYRFFTGVPNTSLAQLFNTLNPELLHFVPAVSDSVAVDMAAGVALCGDKAVVLCSPITFEIAALQIIKFVVKNSLPVLFIIASDPDIDIKKFKLSSGVESLEHVDACVSNMRPAILICGDAF